MKEKVIIYGSAFIVPRENTAWHTRSLGVNCKKQSITLVGNLSEIQRKVNFRYDTGN